MKSSNCGATKFSSCEKSIVSAISEKISFNCASVWKSGQRSVIQLHPWINYPSRKSQQTTKERQVTPVEKPQKGYKINFKLPLELSLRIRKTLPTWSGHFSIFVVLALHLCLSTRYVLTHTHIHSHKLIDCSIKNPFPIIYFRWNPQTWFDFNDRSLGKNSSLAKSLNPHASTSYRLHRKIVQFNAAKGASRHAESKKEASKAPTRPWRNLQNHLRMYICSGLCFFMPSKSKKKKECRRASESERGRGLHTAENQYRKYGFGWGIAK